MTFEDQMQAALDTFPPDAFKPLDLPSIFRAVYELKKVREARNKSRSDEEEMLHATDESFICPFPPLDRPR